MTVKKKTNGAPWARGGATRRTAPRRGGRRRGRQRCSGGPSGACGRPPRRPWGSWPSPWIASGPWRCPRRFRQSGRDPNTTPSKDMCGKCESQRPTSATYVSFIRGAGHSDKKNWYWKGQHIIFYLIERTTPLPKKTQLGVFLVQVRGIFQACSRPSTQFQLLCPAVPSIGWGIEGKTSINNSKNDLWWQILWNLELTQRFDYIWHIQRIICKHSDVLIFWQPW